MEEIIMMPPPKEADRGTGEKATNPLTKEKAYTRDALLRDGRWNPDLLRTLLDPEQTYSIAAVESLVAQFKNGGE